MSDVVDIIISAVDQASDVFRDIVSSITDMGSNIEEVVGMSSQEFDSLSENVTGFQEAVTSIDDSTIQQLADDLGMTTEEVENLISVGADIGSIPFNEASAGADELEQEVTEADDAITQMNDDLGIINSAMLMDLGNQVGNLGGQAEGMAQEMNNAAITVGQLATNAGIAEPQMIGLINNISNATFPQNEAMAYVQTLNQMGVSADKLGDSATNMDRINDATGIGYQKTMELSQGLQAVGISADNLPSSFDAIAFAQANVNGGAGTLSQVLKTQASTINEYGLNVDQLVLIMQKLSEKGVQGRKMGSELSTVLKDNNGDIKAIEESLGLEAGALENANTKTGEYSGTIQKLADEEMQHKTFLDQLGAAWEDVSLSVGQFLTPFLGVVGLLGQVGQFGLQIKGLKELTTLTKGLTEIEIIDSAVKSGKAAIMSVVTVATTAYAAIVGVLSGEIGLVTAATMVWNAVLAMNPIMLVVIALVALVAIIYEVGKAFGWWSDIGGMLSAIWDGINRLWSAFINHPDVKAVISAVSNALSTLWSWIQQAGQAILEFFGVSTGGDFDIVRALIDGVGNAWNTLKGIVTTVTNAFNKFKTGQVDLGATVISVLSFLFNSYVTILSSIASFVLQFAETMAKYALQAGIKFVNNIVNRINKLPGRFLSYLTKTSQHIINQGTKWVNTAKTKANQLVTGAINYIKNLPSKALTYLVKVVSSISTAGGKWINAAGNYASKVVSKVINNLSNLPGKVATEFGKIPGKINSAVSSAVSAAANFGSNIKNAVLKALHIASPGIIQRKIKSEFWDTVDRIKETARPAYEAGKSYGENILNGFNSIDLSRDSLLDTSDFNTAIDVNGNTFDIHTGQYYEVDDNLEITVKQEHEFTFSFKDVPEWIDTDKLMSMIKAAMKDKTLIRELVNNPDFQKLDAEVKDRILRKVKRSKGV